MIAQLSHWTIHQMAFMITKLYTTHMVVYVQILSNYRSCLLKFGHRKRKNKIKIVHVFGWAFCFGAYVKALIGFKAFYFFGSVRLGFGVYVKWHLNYQVKQSQNWYICLHYGKYSKIACQKGLDKQPGLRSGFF